MFKWDRLSFLFIKRSAFAVFLLLQGNYPPPPPPDVWVTVHFLQVQESVAIDCGFHKWQCYDCLDLKVISLTLGVSSLNSLIL